MVVEFTECYSRILFLFCGFSLERGGVVRSIDYFFLDLSIEITINTNRIETSRVNFKNNFRPYFVW